MEGNPLRHQAGVQQRVLRVVVGRDLRTSDIVVTSQTTTRTAGTNARSRTGLLRIDPHFQVTTDYPSFTTTCFDSVVGLR